MTSTYYIGIDGSVPSDFAIRWGIERAEKCGASVVLVHVIDDEWGLVGHAWADESERAGGVLLAAASDAAGKIAPNVPVETRVLRGSPAWELAGIPRPEDLLVIGTHTTGHLHGRVLGSSSVAIAALARCSVAVVPDAPRSARRGVVVGVDWSAGSAPAVVIGAREAMRLQQDVIIVHASPAVLPESANPCYPESAMESLLRTASAIATEAAPAVRVRTRALRKRTAEALLDAARDAVLLVVGVSLRHDDFAGVLGTVTHDVLMNVNVPVLVARPGLHLPALAAESANVAMQSR